MDYDKVIISIIESQEAIIGGMAITQANQVEGLVVSKDKHVSLQGDGNRVVDLLVDSYKNLFGDIAVEVCKEAAHKAQPSLSPDKFPASLKS